MKTIHILLVEDNEGDIFLTKEAFKDGKLLNEISVARDGCEAMLYLQKKGRYSEAAVPDIILLDVNLPKMNGHEVLKAIKSDPLISHIPVIMLTTSSSEKDRLKSQKNQAESFIVKPVDLADFMNIVSYIEHFWISIVHLPLKHTHNALT